MSKRPDRLIRKALPRIKDKARTAARSVRLSLVYGPILALPLDEKKIFVLGREGAELAGNLLRLMLSIRRLYGNRFTWVAGVKGRGRDRIRRMLNAYGFTDTRLVEATSIKGLREMETAAFLITDVTFPNAFIPRKGQRILNTWHGTPYKRMGVDTPSYRLAVDNMQRNFFMADQLLFPSPYCRDVMTAAYCLDGLFQGQMIRAGYPRNSVFFDEESRQAVRRRFGLTGRQVWAYLPTWHEGSGDGIDHLKVLTDTFAYLDGQMTEAEVLYVKIHNYYLSAMESLRLTWRHIRPWPEDIETYEFLNAADVLVTDYSSVFFDFACTGRLIVRYTYDEAAYLASRGLYDLPLSLPFPCAADPASLLRALRGGKTYDDTAFRAAYCPYDGPEAADKAATWFVEGKTPPEALYPAAKNHPLVLLYAGCITDPVFLKDLSGLLLSLSENENRPLFYLGINRAAQAVHPEALSDLPAPLRLLMLRGEAFCSTGNLLLLAAGHPTRAYLATERQRALTGVRFDGVVDLTGRSTEARLFEDPSCAAFMSLRRPSLTAIEKALRRLLK